MGKQAAKGSRPRRFTVESLATAPRRTDFVKGHLARDPGQALQPYGDELAAAGGNSYPKAGSSMFWMPLRWPGSPGRRTRG